MQNGPDGAPFAIAALAAGGGVIGLAPMPGRGGGYAADLAVILRWAPALVLTMATAEELRRHGAATLGADLAAAGIGWRHLPVVDYGAAGAALARGWPEASRRARTALA
ncbi:protein-tyrosine phosphatase family protein, partial [Albidovulum sp.]